MASIFSKIVAGEIPCHKIAESEDYLAFLDINPIVKGHTLVIPKMEKDYIFDLEDEVIGGLMVFAKKVAKALDQAIPSKRVGLMVVGTEVPHAHVHLLPFQRESDINITKPKMTVSQADLAEIAASIRAFVE
ncbi:MAG: HIT family protein [Saprospiraceae bacterium]|nr:HIT family protein [Saprospiraceae bacterium]